MFNGVSLYSDKMDIFTLLMIGICGFVTLGILICMIYFSYKYHASKVSKKVLPFESKKLEIIWTSITLIVFMGFFIGATKLYENKVRPVEADYQIFVYAKRWMWKFYHENGFVEVNNVHIPKGKKINFVMISQDVIHSLYFPDFRVKQDILPEVYTIMSLEPLKEGSYPLFCAEYCGTAHSAMKGFVKVVDEKRYLEATATTPNNKLALTGRELFVKHDCLSCHNSQDTAPSLVGIYSQDKNDDYLRKAIYYPTKEMPSYKNQINEEEMRKLIEYIKSIRPSDEELF